MDENFVEIDWNEVISLEEWKYTIVVNHITFKAGELTETLKKPLGNSIVQNKSGYPGDLLNNWLQDGVGCEILKRGAKDWQTGKVRIKISLEFCPDEPEIEETPASAQTETTQTSQAESPLDDLRKMLNENS